MKRTIVMLVVIAMFVTPLAVFAQEPGSGGPIIEANAGTSIGSLNDIRCSGTDCRDITQWLAVGLVGTDPELQNLAPGVRDGILSTDWTVSDDGLVYTFTLRDDLVWSDGEPIDGWDYQFTYYAHMMADMTESAYAYVTADIEEIAVSDDGYTLSVTFDSPSCQNLSNTGLLVVPSHVFGWTPDMGMDDFDWTSLVDHEFDTNPSVSGGPFKFQSMDSERVVLVTNEDYTAPVIPEGYLYVTVPDQTVAAERFIAGELNVADNPQSGKREEIRGTESLQYYEYSGRTFDYLALNHANPDNPQDGVVLDEDGAVVFDEETDLPIIVEQEPHPIFGDVRVRRAIQHAMNLDEIMEKAVLGEGSIMASYDLPTSWAVDPDLAPIPYDPAAAVALLEEVGWVDSDGDGLLDKDGMVFSFELLTNDGNTRRGQIGELVQQNLAEIGIEVDFVTVDFNQLLDIMDAQTFDAFILGWRWGYPVDPDPSGLFTSDADVVGSGFNFTSYTNAEVDRLAREAMLVPGCAPEDRTPYYHQIQKILQDDQTYVWLFAQNGFYAANGGIDGFGPYPNELFWNADEWAIAK